MNSVFKSMYILLLVVILVFHAALPLLSLNPKPAVKAAVPAQTQLPSTNDAFSYDALSFRLFISVGSLRLRRRPTWDLSRWDSTLGFPGEGPPTGKLGIGTQMDVDIGAGHLKPAMTEPAALSTIASSTLPPPSPVITPEAQLHMGNAIGPTVFDSLWGRMECKITGSAPAFKLGYKCTCATKRLQCSVRKPDDKTWSDACAQLKDSVLQQHSSEKCTPAVVAEEESERVRKRSRVTSNAPTWLDSHAAAAEATEVKKKETARKTAVSEYQVEASGLSQHLAKLKAEIRTFEGELQMHKAAADRRQKPIDHGNIDGFDYECEVAGTDGDDDDTECTASTSAVGSQRATPPKVQQAKAWWKLLRIGQILTYSKVECKVVSVDDKPAGPSVTVELLAGESKGTCVSVNRWSDLVDVGQKFWHPRKGKPCRVIQITRGHVDGEPSLLVSFDDDDTSIVETEFTNLEPSESAEDLQSRRARKLRKRKSRTFKRVIRDPLNGMLPWLQYHAQGSSRRAALIVEALVNTLPESCKDEIRSLLDTDGKAAAAVEHEIANRLCDAIDILKHGTTEQERLELRVLLTAIAHRKKATRTDPTGWGSKFCKRLNINRNGKPYRDSVEHRAGIDMEYARRQARRKQVQEFEVGDEVVCTGGAGTVVWSDGANIMIRVDIDGHVQDFKYNDCGYKPGGGRVRFRPMLFTHGQRKKRKDTVSKDVVDKIRHFFETNCTTSPCAKDIIRSRIGRNIRIEAPMLIMHDTLKKMYDKFVKVFKDVKIGLTEFKRLRPFNARAVKRSGCHCKVCEHYDGLRRGLQKAADMIEEWFDAAEESFNVSFSENKGTDDAIDTESASWRERTKWIIELADLQKKAEHMKLMLCPYLNGDPAMAADACVNGNCCKCGFKNKWKKLRAKLLQHGPKSFVNGGNEAGIQLQPGAPSVFMKLVELDIFESVPVDKEDSVSATIGAADDEEYGANSRKVRLENVRKQVSIIELLDMLDHSFVGMCQHRRTVARCKAAALQLHQNAIPGWVIINTDWAENWVVAPARMLQSQYWAQVSASIHVSVSQWLSSDHWHDRHVLKKGSRVTTADGKEWVVVSQVAEDVSIVSPDEANVESPTTTKIKRSELQTKLNAGDEVTTSTGSYGRVRSQEGSVVQVEIDGDVRQCARNTIHLRHWVTKAFFGLTNDRKQYARAKRTCLHVS